ncbi:hypothetical protein GCM10009853_047370 [Glycomyces scopariae]
MSRSAIVLFPEPETPMTTTQVPAMSLLVAGRRRSAPLRSNLTPVHMFGEWKPEATVRSPDSAFHPEGAQPVRSPNTCGHSHGQQPRAVRGATPMRAAACLGGDTAFRLV